MKKRLILLAGLGVGFILGSRTGRQSYEKLKAQAQDLWTDPRVQDTVEKANQSIRDKSPAVADAVQDTVEKVNAAAAGVDPSVSEFDGDEDGSAKAPSTGAASPGANAAGSTGAGAGAAGAAKSASESAKSGSSSAKSGSGSAKSGSGSAKSAASSTGSNAAKSGSSAAKSDSSKSSVPKPSEVKHDPHVAGAAKSQDTLADPERSLDDEGPAGVSSED